MKGISKCDLVMYRLCKNRNIVTRQFEICLHTYIIASSNFYFRPNLVYIQRRPCSIIIYPYAFDICEKYMQNFMIKYAFQNSLFFMISTPFFTGDGCRTAFETVTTID